MHIIGDTLLTVIKGKYAFTIVIDGIERPLYIFKNMSHFMNDDPKKVSAEIRKAKDKLKEELGLEQLK